VEWSRGSARPRACNCVARAESNKSTEVMQCAVPRSWLSNESMAHTERALVNFLTPHELLCQLWTPAERESNGLIGSATTHGPRNTRPGPPFNFKVPPAADGRTRLRSPAVISAEMQFLTNDIDPTIESTSQNNVLQQAWQYVSDNRYICRRI